MEEENNQQTEQLMVQNEEILTIEQDKIDSVIFRPIYVINFHDQHIFNYEEPDPSDDGRKCGELRERLETKNRRVMEIQGKLGLYDKDSEEYKLLSSELEVLQRERDSLSRRISQCKFAPIRRQTSMVFGKMTGNVHNVMYRRYIPRKKVIRDIRRVDKQVK